MFKKLMSLALASLLVLTLSACGSGNSTPSGEPGGPSSIDLEAFYGTLFQGEDAPMMMPLEGDEMIEGIYPGLTAIARSQTVLYTAAMAAVAAEAAMVEVADAADVNAVRDIFQARIDTQVGTDDAPGGAWYPETIENWRNNSEIVVKGNFVCLFVGEDKDEMVSAFQALR